MSKHTHMQASLTETGAKLVPRLSKESWLDLGTEMLSKYGTGGLTIEKLTYAAKVTRGSFYWHFKSHDEFLAQLTNKWLEDFTQSVISATNAHQEMTPRERLRYTLINIIAIGRSGLDVQFRELATRKPRVKQVVDQVDAFRTDFIRSLFQDLGYTGEDLETRVHAFVVLHSLEMFVNTGIDVGKDPEHIADRRLDFFLS